MSYTSIKLVLLNLSITSLCLNSDFWLKHELLVT